MSFREKSAWITLLTVLVCFGVYFGAVVGGLTPPGLHAVHLLLGCVIVLVVLQIALHIIAAATSPNDARAPADERERLIQMRSHTIGYYVLVVLILSLGIPGHLGHSVPEMLNFALLDLVIATLAVSAAQIVMFRRGS